MSDTFYIWDKDLPNRIDFVLTDTTNREVAGLGSNFTIQISKNAGAFAAGTGAKSEIGLGWYSYEATAAEADTLGPVALVVTAAGCAQQNLEYVVESRAYVTPILPPTAARPSTLYDIRDLVGDRLVELLTAYCKTSVETDATTSAYAATVVRMGALQENPVEDRIALLVNLADPDDLAVEPTWADNVAGSRQSEQVEVPAYEIGGGEMHWIRYSIEVDVYLTQTHETRSEARRVGLWVIGRAQQALRANKSLGLTDDFGVTALFMLTGKVTALESGGPPTSFIWRGKLYVSALTESSEAA